MKANPQFIKEMQKQHGRFPGQTKDALQIIRETVQRESKIDFDTFLRKLYTLLQNKENKLIQFGDTVFLMGRIANDIVEMHTFSSEHPKQLVGRFKEAANFAKKQGMKKLITFSDQPGYLRLAKETGLPVNVSQSTKKLGGQVKPMYQYEVTL
jgi:hypothetical protein